ncbi:magnesium transporter CorA [Flavobacterium album]|uniref:Magnesium transporter CorA n=1 Tax=Flavobacterium album TaxID=2175091 RepID=A0A2S1QVE0_9FLAO|nr:magnesium transporter CorA family protein [Flavobacterium album]AWH84354.1 magnesium transporter CorA [Flavobacterium album]
MITFYKNGNGLEVAENASKSIWINAIEPTLSETAYLLEELQIPQAFYNDIEDMDERPRIETEDGWTLIILRIPYHTNDEKLPYSTAPLGLVFGHGKFISLCFVKNHMVTDFITYTQRKQVTITNDFDLVLKLLLSASVWYQKYLKQINHRIKVAENSLEQSIRNEDLQALLQLEKCLVYFITSLKGNDTLFYRIRNLRNYNSTFDPDLLEDVDIELKQAQDSANIYSNILSGMMDAYASVISNNLNIIMKKLTSISIILMIPTFIASMYGMNVPNALENNPYGLWIILFISLIISGISVFMFKRKKLF